VLATWAEIGKADQLLLWRPQVGHEEGVLLLAVWDRENWVLARELETS
jgi:hypothetical protein